MDMKRLAIGTIVGGITLYAAGYLIFDLATADFYVANLIADTGAYRDPSLQWAFVLGDLASGALVTLGILSRPGTPTIGSGLLTGAVIGLLLWLHADLTLYGLTNVWNITTPMVDPLLEAIHHGAGGAVIAAVLARVPRSAAIRPAE